MARAWSAWSRAKTPPALTDEDDRLLRELARRIQRSRLAPAVTLWLEASRPLTFLGAQLLLVIQPLVTVLLPAAPLNRIATLLEDRAGVEHLLAMIAEDEAGAPAQGSPRPQGRSEAPGSVR